MKKNSENSNEVKKELMTEIVKLRDTIEGEYDLLELIEDSIKDIFDCDLHCSTCTEEERGTCMQNFKKANLYWIRKVAQDEWALKNFADNVGKLYILIEKLTGIITKTLKSTKIKDEFDNIVDERKQIEASNKQNSNIYS